MKKEQWIVLGLVLWAVDAWAKSHAGTTAYDSAYQKELANFRALAGTNFTNSVWDPVSGQPAYQFGAIDAPGGAGLQANDYAGAFGHM